MPEMVFVTKCNKFVIFLLTRGGSVDIITFVTSCNKFVIYSKRVYFGGKRV